MATTSIPRRATGGAVMWGYGALRHPDVADVPRTGLIGFRDIPPTADQERASEDREQPWLEYVDACLKLIGTHGWELVSVVAHGVNERFYFKRPAD